MGFATLRRERASIVSVTFFAMTLSTTVWLLSFGAIYSARDSSIALDWVRIEHVGLVFIPTTVLLFAAAVTGQLHEKKALAWIGVAASVALYVIVVSADWIVKDLHQFYWGYYPQSGKLAPLLLAFFGVFLGTSLHMLRVSHGLTQSAAQRRRLKAIIVALAVAYLGTIDFLPTFGVPVYPFGYLFICAFVVLATRAIWQYRLVDITPALAAEQIIHTMAEGLLVVDRDGVIRVANDTAAEMFGRPRKSLLGTPCGEIDFVWMDGSFSLDADRDEQQSRSEVSYRRRDGTAGTAIVSASPLKDHTGEWVGTIYIMYDITERRRAEEQIRYLAFHDTLTGAATRAVLIDRLSNAVAQARRDQRVIGLIFVDLDGFKEINDTKGHEAGDELLRRAADELAQALREGDTLARVGGDEFVILLPAAGSPAEVIGVANRILQRLNKDRGNGEIGGRVSASLGVATYPRDGQDAETLLRHADAAMYEVKRRGGNDYQLFGVCAAPEIPARERFAS
jgi:diguanylate cyclase (GGDEF)-like protein/PAS domain S-box-containing protein